MHNLTLSFRSKEEVSFEDNTKYYLEIPVLLDSPYYHSERVDFLIDTGAYLTVINKSTSDLLGFDSLPLVFDFELPGFAGSCKAAFKELPGLIVGDRVLKGVKAAIPYIDTEFNILGMNVLEHFKFYLDTENEYIYFSDNPNYKLPKELSSSGIYLIGDTEHASDMLHLAFDNSNKQMECEP